MGHEYAWRTQTLADQVDQSIVQERLLGILSGGFAVLALLLTAIGLFGSISCRVTQRTREIGIRMALGARKKEVFCLVMKDSLLPVAAGIIVGLAGSMAASHLISHLLYEIGPTDPPIFLASVAAVLLSGILAAYLPASRATGLAPSSALRSE